MSFGPLLDRFHGLKALVVGDLMLDEYLFGRATRISPEAPVMVVRHQRTARLPGGAANVARNLLALGAETFTIGVAGCDDAGDLLETSLREQGLVHVNLIRDPSRNTTRKTRVLADHTHQVLRIDQEDDAPIAEEVEESLTFAAKRLIQQCDVIVLSDYLKGALTPSVARELVSEAKRLGKPVVVNPKPRSVATYKGATLVSLNRAEASEAIGAHRSLSDGEAIDAARKIREQAAVDGVVVTLGESGMAASGASEFKVEAPKVEVYDTAGAGDTVIATVALGIATAGFEKPVFELAAQMAACVVRHVGVATPSATDIENIRATSDG